jgi:Rod binding domain-containing protein
MPALEASPSLGAALAAYGNAPLPRRFVPEGGGAISLGNRARLADIERTATDFEAFFASAMLESMTAGIKPDQVFGGGQAEQMYRSLLNQEYGKEIAKRGSLGIADAVKREMLRLQENAG